MGARRERTERVFDEEDLTKAQLLVASISRLDVIAKTMENMVVDLTALKNNDTKGEIQEHAGIALVAVNAMHEQVKILAEALHRMVGIMSTEWSGRTETPATEEEM